VRDELLRRRARLARGILTRARPGPALPAPLLRRIERWEGGRVQGTSKLLLAAGTTRLGTCRRRISVGDDKGGDDEVGEVGDAPEAERRGLIHRRPLLLVRCGAGASSSRVTLTHCPPRCSRPRACHRARLRIPKSSVGAWTALCW
jgi:hypothetical protein